MAKRRADRSSPNIQRLLGAFRREPIDRVPNFEVLIGERNATALLGKPTKHTLADIEPEDYIEIVRIIGQDAIGMNFYSNPFYYRDEGGNVKPIDFRMQTEEDFERLLPVSLDREIRPKLELLERYREAVEGTEIGLFALTGAFLTTTYDSIFGFEKFMIKLYEDMPLVERVLDAYVDFYEQVVRAVLDYDLSFLYIGDDVAYKSGLFIRPEMFRPLWIPRMDRLMAPARRRGVPIMFHSDGNIREIIPDLLEMGICALNPVEPYGMDARAIKDEFGDRLCLVGNLDVGGALSRGTPKDVRRETLEMLDSLAPGGGYVAASSHSITDNVPPENFMAMIETIHEYNF